MKKKYGKWIGGGLGWAIGGPIGAILGYAVGSVFDGASTHMQGGNSNQTTTGGFIGTLLILIAAVMKADGKILKSELDHVKIYFNRTFGEAKTKEAMILLREILEKDIPLQDVCNQVDRSLDYSSKLQIIQFLLDISKADGHVHPNEMNIIEFIARNIGVVGNDYSSMNSMYDVNNNASYKILGVDSKATNDEVKKAYREMAKKYHPDKVSHLGDDIRDAANEKFKKLNDAYEKVKKERGMN